MADSAVVITQGTGTNIDTRTESTNGNHRQVVILGDPATNAGVAPVDATNGLSVTLTTALPAGSAAIGKLAANSGVDIGDVTLTAGANNIGSITDVTGTVSLPTGASTAAKQPSVYTEDAAAAADPEGNMLLARRKDTLSATEVSADGDNIALNATNKGQLHVKLADTVTVDGSGVTQPVSASSLPLPSGAATSAKQDTGNTSLASIDGKITAVNTGAVVISSGNVTADTELTTADLDTGAGTDTKAVVGVALGKSGGALILSSGQQTMANSLPVSVASDQSAIPASQSGTWTVQPGNTANTTAWKVDASSVAVPVTDNSGSLTVDYATTGSGTATGALRVELANNGTGVVGLNAGTNNIGQVSVAPQTANGLSVFNATSSDGATALTSTAQAIKASAGQVYGWYIYNPNSSAQFVQFYNVAAASVTVGTTNPLFMLTIPATSAANVEFTNGITFSNAGFSCAATSTAGGNGAPSTALDAVIFYK